MTATGGEAPVARLRAALGAPASSARLHAALTAGSSPHAGYVDALVERCAVEPDFYVRDMLTWALVRHDASQVIARLLIELDSGVAQARAQALHTLSKIGRPDTWVAITPELLRDEDDDVARAAWRTAVVLVPEDELTGLARALASQLARGDRDVRLSLSRAFVALGAAAMPVVEQAALAGDADIRAHAIATARLMDDPDEAFDVALHEARRLVALRDAPTTGE